VKDKEETSKMEMSKFILFRGSEFNKFDYWSYTSILYVIIQIACISSKNDYENIEFL